MRGPKRAKKPNFYNRSPSVSEGDVSSGSESTKTSLSSSSSDYLDNLQYLSNYYSKKQKQNSQKQQATAPSPRGNHSPSQPGSLSNDEEQEETGNGLPLPSNSNDHGTSNNNNHGAAAKNHTKIPPKPRDNRTEMAYLLTGHANLHRSMNNAAQMSMHIFHQVKNLRLNNSGQLVKSKNFPLKFR